MNKPIDTIEARGSLGGQPFHGNESGLCWLIEDATGECRIAHKPCRFHRGGGYHGGVLPEFCPLREGPVTISLHSWHYDETVQRDNPTVEQRIAAIPIEAQIDEATEAELRKAGNPFWRLDDELEREGKYAQFAAETRHKVACGLHDRNLEQLISKSAV
jgi:hypothetical protein